MSKIIMVILALSAVSGVVFIILGFKSGGEFKDFSLNIGTELIGIFITVFAIEYIYRREEKKASQQEEKKRLIRILNNASRQGVVKALDKLIDEEWLFDGSIKDVTFYDRDFSGLNFGSARFVNCWFAGVTFDEANLQHVTFKGGGIAGKVSFKNTYMYSINLEGFSYHGVIEPLEMLLEYMLLKAKCLRYAIMPDGKRYDGRYRLPGDLEYSKIYGIQWDLKHHTLPGIAEKMAAFYDVSLEEYLAGQDWARENSNLIYEAGVDALNSKL